MEIPYTVEVRPDTGLYNAKLGLWLFLASEMMLFGGLFSAYLLLRVGAEEWPHGLLNVPLGTFNTLVLITSSITVVMAWAALKFKQYQNFRRYLGITVLCGIVFLGIKGYEYREKFSHYELQLADGRVLAGHLEGNPLFLNLSQLLARKVDHLAFHADRPEGKSAPEPSGPIQIAVKEITRLSCFGPWLNTFLALYFTMTAVHGLHVFGGILVLGWFWGPGAAMWRTEPERLTNRVEVAGLYWHFVDLIWLVLFPVLYLL